MQQLGTMKKKFRLGNGHILNTVLYSSRTRRSFLGPFYNVILVTKWIVEKI
jgi:hypothetical protein